MTIRMGAGGAVVVESGALLSSKTYVSSFCEQKVKINMNISNGERKNTRFIIYQWFVK